MKVLIALNSAWNLLNFRAGLIKALLADGHTVVLAAPSDESVPALKALGARFVNLPMNTHGTNPLVDLLLLARFVRLLRHERPDVLLGYTAKPNIYGALAAHALGVAVVNNISGLGSVFIRGGWLAKVLQQLYRLALARSKRVFFQNSDDLKLFLTLGLVKLEQIGLLPGSGIDLKHFSPLPLPSLMSDDKREFKKHFVFLLVARLLKDKGLFEYVAAAKIVKKKYPFVEFRLLGSLDVNNPNAVTQAQLNLWCHEGTITYLGISKDVREQMSRSDCIVLPSYREGTPRTLLEAAAMARPLIATDVPGCREVVIHKVNGYLCQVYDSEDLAKKIEKILKLPPAELFKMGLAARKHVEKNYNENIIIESYKNLLYDLKNK